MKKVYTTEIPIEKLIYGISIVENCVGVTYGPLGSNVAMQRPSGHICTKDGASVLREISIEDRISDIPIKLIKSAVRDLDRELSDGSSTATLLCTSFLKVFLKQIAGGVDPNEIAKDIESQLSMAIEIVDVICSELENETALHNLLSSALNGDVKTAKLIAEASLQVGKQGVILVEDGKGVHDEIIFRDGLQISYGKKRGVSTQGEGENFVEQPLIAIIDDHISKFGQIKEVLEESTQWPNPLVIFCKSLSGDALVTILTNKDNKPCIAIPINNKRYQRDLLLDIAAISGAKVLSAETGTLDYDNFDPSNFGSVQTLTAKDETTDLVAYADPESEKRILERIGHLSHEKQGLQSGHDRDQIEKRISALSGGLAVLRIGGFTEFQIKEKRARVEDSLGCLKQALNGGVVPSIPSSLIFIAHVLEQSVGKNAFSKALEGPMRWVCQRSATEPSVAIEKLKQAYTEYDNANPYLAWDVQTQSIVQAGVESMIDPANTLRRCLETAASLTITLCKTKGLIIK